MRDELDRYYTTDEDAAMIVEQLDVNRDPKGVLEPCVGGGAFVRACRARWGEHLHIAGADIDPGAVGLTECTEPLEGDVRTMKLPPADRIDLVITNPPFIIAEEVARRLLEDGYRDVVLLLPLSFLASGERKAFWRDHPLTGLDILSDRPGYLNAALGLDGRSTAPADYGLMRWQAQCEPLPIRWLSYASGPRGLDSIRWRTVE